MSSVNGNADFIALLSNVSNLLNRYVPIFIYLFGITGNVLNVLVLGQRTFRTTPSPVFFLVSSIAGIIAILGGLTSRMMSGYGLDLTLTVSWICKVRNFVLYTSRTILSWAIVSATLDRYLSSSVHVQYRQMSNMKNVQRSLYFIIVCSCLMNAPIIFCYEGNLTGVLRGCYGATYMCRASTDLIYAFGTALVPLFLMMVFGLMTIRNVHGVRRRVHAMTASVLSHHDNKNTVATANSQRQTRKRDRSLLRMLFVQVSLLILLTCPHASQKVYSTLTTAPPAQSLENAIQTFIFNILTLLTFTASGMPFYIYTLAGGNTFKKPLYEILKNLREKFSSCR